ncbi:hypothetical protein [Caldimonas sp. KR1-144]|uniref:hypothetical protein n=1 Tax=Caldimonas sp. KR1-144 TaxID=3400911 RepID=UPI003C03CF2D
MRVKKHDGHFISYEGAGFEGSPRRVFWSRYIEPFLEDLVVREITAASKEARERHVDARQLLPEVQGLLLSGCSKVFQRMAQIDQRLLGKGYPATVPLRSVAAEYQGMQEFIAKHVTAELAMWKPRRAYEVWYEQNKFVVWVVGAVLAVAGLLVKFL